jgi:hypothetical protein
MAIIKQERAKLGDLAELNTKNITNSGCGPSSTKTPSSTSTVSSLCSPIFAAAYRYYEERESSSPLEAMSDHIVQSEEFDNQAKSPLSITPLRMSFSKINISSDQETPPCVRRQSIDLACLSQQRCLKSAELELVSVPARKIINPLRMPLLSNIPFQATQRMLKDMGTLYLHDTASADVFVRGVPLDPCLMYQDSNVVPVCVRVLPASPTRRPVIMRKVLRPRKHSTRSPSSLAASSKHITATEHTKSNAQVTMPTKSVSGSPQQTRFLGRSAIQKQSSRARKTKSVCYIPEPAPALPLRKSHFIRTAHCLITLSGTRIFIYTDRKISQISSMLCTIFPLLRRSC